MSDRASTLSLRTWTVQRWADQRGQSLVEVLIVAAIAAVVLGSIGTLLVTSQRQQQKNANYDNAQASAQVELDRMVSEIRDAWNIISWGPNSVDMDVNIGGVGYQVLYECDLPAAAGLNKCVRVQAPVGASLPALSTGPTVIDNLSNGSPTAPVFTWQSELTAPGPATTTTSTTTSSTSTTATPVPIAPDYVTATVDVPASDGVTASALTINRTITFSDGALIRNVDVEN